MQCIKFNLFTIIVVPFFAHIIREAHLILVMEIFVYAYSLIPQDAAVEMS